MSLAFKIEHRGRIAEIGRVAMRHARGQLVENTLLKELLRLTEGEHHEPVGPEQLATDLETLGPAFIKLGQLLSTRADLIPEEYARALERLQDDIEPVPFDEIVSIVETELGARLSKLFDLFDAEPIATASLGQVHRATLRDGRIVAVKVQRPGVGERVNEDLEILREMAEFADAHTDVGRRTGFASIVKELRESLSRELDYRTEARNLQRLRTNLAGFFDIRVPAHVPDYTTGKVLTMEFIEGMKVTDIPPVRRTEMELGPLAEEIFRAYLKQVLVDGFFHADPHPGNVLLTDDGRIALIDLGMVAHASPAMRNKLLKLLVAIGNGWGDQAADVAIDIGEPLPSFDREAAKREISALVSWSEGMTVSEIDVGRVVLGILSICRRNGMRTPADLAMLAKTLMNLDEVGRALDPAFDPNAAIRRRAKEIEAQRMRDAMSPENFMGVTVEARDFLQALPARANKILDKLANDEMAVSVDAIDEDRLIAGLQKIANRITLGLLLASLVVGAALFARVPTTWTVMGYPGMALLLFLAAALGAACLAVHILRHDIKDPS